MKKILGFILIIIFLFSFAGKAVGDDYDVEKLYPEEEIPPGMEIIHIGSAKLVVPEGTKIREDGSVTTLETINEYTGRRFLEMDERLSSIEQTLEALKEDVAQLKEESTAQAEAREKELQEQISKMQEELDKIKKE